MVSFASPLFWQINYLVSNLNKKNFKTNVAELNQLVELYGEDARVFLLKSLVDGIDFRDTKGTHKDALKIQILVHEISQTMTQSNFASVVCVALGLGSGKKGKEHSKARVVSEEFLNQFCKTLKLPLPQQIMVTLAVVATDKQNVEALNFLKLRLAEVSSSGSKLSEEVLHSLLFILKTNESFKDTNHHFIEELKILHPEIETNYAFFPLSRNKDSFVDASLESLPTFVEGAQVAFYELMEELGYSCCQSPESFRAVLVEAGVQKTLDPLDIAGLIVMLARKSNNSILETDINGVLASNLSSYGESTPSTEPIVKAWNLDVICEVLTSDYPTVDGEKIAEGLDRSDLIVEDEQSFSFLLSMFRKLSGKEQLPLAPLFKEWQNAASQAIFLSFAVNAPVEILSFASSPNKLQPFEGADVASIPRNQAWLSLDLMNTLLRLAETGSGSIVKKIFEGPKSFCPDIFVASLANADSKWSEIRAEIFADLFSLYLHMRPNSPAMLRYLWSVSRNLVLNAAAKIYWIQSSPAVITRLFALFRNTADAFPTVLQSNYFSLAISLAVMGANHDLVHLESWIKERLATHRSLFAAACMLYVRNHYTKALPKCNISTETSAFLSIESLAILIKTLVTVAQAFLDRVLLMELKELHLACCKAHPIIAGSIQGATAATAAGATTGAGAAGNGEDRGSNIKPANAAATAAAAAQPTNVSSDEIEEKANAYFQRIYTSEQSIEEVIDMLTRFKNSDKEMEQSIFLCMIHNLFDEYRFFPKYPDVELRITGILFGKLIQHQLVTQMTLNLALRCVLDALRKPVDTKLFRFGLFALEQFIQRLPEMPQYCSHLLQTPSLHQSCPELMTKIQAITRSSPHPTGMTGDYSSANPVASMGNQFATGSATGSSTKNASSLEAATSPLIESATPAPPLLQQQAKSMVSSLTDRTLADSMNHNNININMNRRDTPINVSSSSVGVGVGVGGAVGPSLQVVATSRALESKVSPSTINVDHIFSERSLDDSAMDGGVGPPPPEDNIQDRFHFTINNMSISNLESKLNEVRTFIAPSHFAWLADYLVSKRISTQSNYHGVYMIMIEKLGFEDLELQILKKALQSVRKLLVSDTITTNSQQRSLLKSLGSWLGLFTLSRNKALLMRDIDLKELLYVGYETGHLIAVTPFVAKILEGCKKSKIFKPPNPWVMGLMHAMREIYDVPDLKLNIKFEIEVLCKALELKVDDLQKANEIHARQLPLRAGNPDFNIKSEPKSVNASPMSQPAHGRGGVVEKKRDAKMNGMGAGTGPGTGVGSGVGAGSGAVGNTDGQMPSGFQENTVIPNLAAYVTINPALTLFQENVNLKRIVPVAVDRAIREIISPVVERSVTIASITTRELTTKDFSSEGDENKMRKAAHLMVTNLAGSLALVTCKEPLRVSISNHLKTLLSNVASEEIHVEQVVQVCAAENLELGCMLIEKAATEKAIRDIDEALTSAFVVRRRHREQQSTQPFFDVNVFTNSTYNHTTSNRGNGGVSTSSNNNNSTSSGGSSSSSSGGGNNSSSSSLHGSGSGDNSSANNPRYPNALPEVFRPRVGGLKPQQLAVYEAFQGLPRQPTTAMSGSSTGSNGGGVGGVGGSSSSSSSSTATPPLNAITGSALAPAPAGSSSVSSTATSSSSSSSMPTTLSSRTNALAESSSHVLPTPTASPSSMSMTHDETSSSTHATLAPAVSLSNVALVVKKFGSLLDLFQEAVQGIVRQSTGRDIVPLVALPKEHDIYRRMQEVRHLLLVQTIPEIRPEACLAIAQHICKVLYQLGGRGDELLLDILVASLEIVVEACSQLKPEITGWILRAPVNDKLKLHCEIINSLIRCKILNLGDLDIYLTRNIERNINTVDFALHIIRQCLSMEHVNVSREFPNCLKCIERLVHLHGGGGNAQVAGIVKILEQVKSSAVDGLEAGAAATTTTLLGSQSETVSSAKASKSATSLSTAASAIPKAFTQDQIAFRGTVSTALEHWINICKESRGGEQVYAQYLVMLKQYGVMKDEESIMMFFKVATEICIETTLKIAINTSDGGMVGKLNLNYAVIDSYAKLIVLLVKYADPNATVKLSVLNKALSAISGVLARAVDASRVANMMFDQRLFARVLSDLLEDLTLGDPTLEPIQFQILSTFATTFNSLQPLVFPAFAFGWTELVMHRSFMPPLLMAKGQRGWPIVLRLLINLIMFLEPYLRSLTMTNGVRLMYKGLLRIMLVLLHDFPEFLCDFHSSFCDVLPSSCVQIRNLILSAFPRNMRLPDPLAPGLQIAMIPEVAQAPVLPPNCFAALGHHNLQQDIAMYFKTQQPMSFLLELPSKLVLPLNQVATGAPKYSIPTVNALILFVGTHGMSQMSHHTEGGEVKMVLQQGPTMDIFCHLCKELDYEGRYLMLSAMANHLRFPNSHTHYFSCVLLYLFATASEAVKEQVTRVLLERLIAHRPHPWGLLITFIELIRNKSYLFWNQKCLESSSELRMVFDDVARSCLGQNNMNASSTPRSLPSGNLVNPVGTSNE